MKSPFAVESDPSTALEIDELEDGFEFEKEQLFEGPSSSSGTQTPTGSFGVLTIRGRPKFRYAFTAEDALWLARFVIGEAGGRDDAGSRAVIWAMFNRYALFTSTRYRTFSSFLRAYSTPLQPILNSGGAAARHYRSADFVRTGGNYTGKYAHVPRGQLGRYLRLQATPWSSLKASARALAERALRGQIPNPIGNASDFENTVAYFRQHYGRPPKMDEWRAYNATVGRLKKRKWIGDVPDLTQYNTNAFFVSDRAAKLPQVRSSSPEAGSHRRPRPLGNSRCRTSSRLSCRRRRKPHWSFPTKHSSPKTPSRSKTSSFSKIHPAPRASRTAPPSPRAATAKAIATCAKSKRSCCTRWHSAAAATTSDTIPSMRTLRSCLTGKSSSFIP